MAFRVTEAVLRELVAQLNTSTSLEPRYELGHYQSKPILYSLQYRAKTGGTYRVYSQLPARALYDAMLAASVAEIDADVRHYVTRASRNRT